MTAHRSATLFSFFAAPASLSLVVALVAACGGPKGAPGPATAGAGGAGPVAATAEPGAPAPPFVEAERAVPLKPEVAPDVPSGEAAARDAELSASAAAIYDAYFNSSPWLSPDGKKVVFVSNRDGIPQLYVADTARPAGAALRLTSTTERAIDPQVTPDGKSVVYVSDRGADENFSIFSVPLEGGTPVELTPGETIHRDTPVIVAGPPAVMVYTGRAKAEKSARLFVHPLEAGAAAPKVAYTDPGSAFLSDVSPDGKRALLLRIISLSESVVLLVDLLTGAAREIDPTPGKTEMSRAAAFSADGARIFVATDGGGESANLIALDAATFAETARYVETAPATALFGGFDVSKKGDRIVVPVDAGNRSEIRILDAKTLKPTAKVTMPLGTGGALRFDAGGKTIAGVWSTPSTPADLWAIDAKTGKVRALRKEVRPALVKLRPLDASFTEVVSFDGTKVPVNLYLPKPLPKGKKLPVIVMVHGGPASSSAIRWSPFTRYFASHGFAIVEPNVRGSTGFGRAYEKADDGTKRLDSVKDMEAVGRWAITQPWADPERLVVMGGSYGGYMTLMGVTHHPDLWKAGVNLFGIYSWNTFMTTTSGVIRDIFQIEIGPESDRAFLDSISPKAKIDAAVAPLFVYAGENDPRVPRSESDQIVASYRGRRIPVEYMVAENEGHSLARKENVTAFLARSARFLETALKIPR